MTSLQTYLSEVERILGTKIDADGSVKLHFEYNNYEEARALLQKIRLVQKELRALKRDVNQTRKEVQSEYSTKGTMVGKGIGSGLASAFLGRKAVGSFNAVRRDDIRRQKEDAVAPYKNFTLTIDRIIHRFDEIKHNVEMSEEYADKPKRRGATRQPAKPESTLEARVRKYYAYIDGEVRGPFEEPEIGTLWKAGSVRGDTPLCVEGENDWHPASHFFNI